MTLATLLAARPVLIVEDEPVIAFTLEDMLIEGGAEPIVAESLDQAFAVLEGNRIDAAVLDVNIHGQKSYPLADYLAERAIPFIFASGYGDALHPAAFAQVPTIAKPYTLDEVFAALARAMG